MTVQTDKNGHREMKRPVFACNNALRGSSRHRKNCLSENAEQK